jgi:hypothetical protein
MIEERITLAQTSEQKFRSGNGTGESMLLSREARGRARFRTLGHRSLRDT